MPDLKITPLPDNLVEVKLTLVMSDSDVEWLRQVSRMSTRDLGVDWVIGRIVQEAIYAGARRIK